MNTIEFNIRKPLDTKYNQNTRVVDIYVDDRSLLDLVTEFEKRFPGKPPGVNGSNYDGTRPDWLLGRLKAKSMAYVLGCICLEPGCWPIQVDIDETPSSVIWRNFRNPYHSHKDNPKRSREYWDYSAFPTFEFSKEEYARELAKLEDSLRQHRQ
jgi:hypothetical protein